MIPVHPTEIICKVRRHKGNVKSFSKQKRNGITTSKTVKRFSIIHVYKNNKMEINELFDLSKQTQIHKKSLLRRKRHQPKLRGA